MRNFSRSSAGRDLVGGGEPAGGRPRAGAARRRPGRRRRAALGAGASTAATTRRALPARSSRSRSAISRPPRLQPEPSGQAERPASWPGAAGDHHATAARPNAADAAAGRCRGARSVPTRSAYALVAARGVGGGRLVERGVARAGRSRRRRRGRATHRARKLGAVDTLSYANPDQIADARVRLSDDWSRRWPTTARVGDVPPKRHTALRDDDGAPATRGADGGGGLLLRLLAALPPRRAVGDRRQPRSGSCPTRRARPTTRSSRATSSCTTLGDAGSVTPSRAAGWCSATTTSGSPTSSPAPTRRRYYRNAIGDECVYVETGHRHRRDGLRRAALPHRRLRDRPARDRRTAGCPAEAEPALRDRGQQPHRAAQALPLALRPAPRARAVLRARPARPDRAVRPTEGTDVEVLVKHRTSAGHRRHADDLRHPPVRRRRLGRLPLPLHVQHRGLHADHRQGPPAAAGAPGLRGLQLRDLQLPAPQGRLPRRCRSRCPTTTPTSTPTRSCSTSAATTRPARARASASARSRCTRAATRTVRSPARSRPRSGSTTSTSRPSWSTPSRPLELGEGGLRRRGPGVRLDLGRPRPALERRRRRARGLQQQLRPPPATDPFGWSLAWPA